MRSLVSVFSLMWYKRRTETNVGLRQTSDWYKRRTSTNVGPVQTLDRYVYKVEFAKKKTIAIRNKIKITHLL